MSIVRLSTPLRRELAITLIGLFAFVLALWVTGFALRFAPEPIGSHADLFAEGARTTLALTVFSGSLGLILGLMGGLARTHGNKVTQTITSTLVWILRGTPLLVQILFIYYALPAIFPLLRFNEFTAATIALALNVGAYNAEAIRAGILAVPQGQTEAARSLGMSRFQTLRWIVLPQALQIVIPPLVNNLVALLKDSALASSIGLLELTLAGNRVSSETFRPVPVLLTVAIIYLLLTTLLTLTVQRIEKSLSAV